MLPVPAIACRRPCAVRHAQTNKQTNNPTGKKLKFASAFFSLSLWSQPDRKKMLEKKIATLRHTKVLQHSIYGN
jgi:hypothetical protein